MPSRRNLLAGVGTAGAAALAGCLVDEHREPDLSGEWRQPGRDVANTSHAPGATLPGDLEESWRVPIGSWPYVPPVVADGSSGPPRGPTVFAAGSYGVFALDAADGAERWSRDLDGEVAAGLALSGDALVVPERRRDGPDRLRALDVADGADRWAVPLESRPFAPSVADGRVYLRTRDAVLAVADGESLWRRDLDRLVYEQYNVDDSPAFTSMIAPAVTPDRIVVPDRHAVAAFDREDGTERWRVDLHGSFASPVAVDDAILAVGLDDVVALRRDGTERWRTAEGGWATVAAADGTAYVLGGNELRALALPDGERAWDARVTGDIRRSQPAIAGDAVAAVGGGVVAVRQDDPGLFGDRELFRAGGAVHTVDHGGLVVGGGRVFVVDGAMNDLVAFRPAE